MSICYLTRAASAAVSVRRLVLGFVLTLAFQCHPLAAAALRGAPAAISSFAPASGTPGTSITISGSNFTGVREVRFNAAIASFTVASSSRIIATVPVDATTGPIGVATAAGTAATSNFFFVAPRIDVFSPSSGSPGASVTIQGANFGGATAVRFNDKNAASFAVVAETQIQATVPAGASSGPISVITPSGAISSTNVFVIAGTEPIITGFSPANGSSGTIVTLEGRNFTGTIAIKFNGTNASQFFITASTQISVTVPSGATTGVISVTTPSGTGASVQPFVVATQPIISQFSPASGPPGTIIVIEGNNFTGTTAVKFNGTNAASFSVNSPTQISATVPSGAATGPISVTSPSGTGTSASSFSVSPIPFFTGFTPAIGSPGVIVVMDGINFSGATAVRFNGTDAAGFSVNSPTQISATVPLGATTGPVSVTTPKGTGASTNHFVVTTGLPVIASFSPSAGLPGTTVTIEGLYFTGATAVKFNGTNASFSVTASTQITCVVPPEATTGLISVTTPAGTGWSSGRFIVAPRIASFSPTAGVAGRSVVIRGTNFTDVLAVRFNGVAATFTNTSPNEITAAVPASASSGTISVTTPAGVVASTNIFTMLPNLQNFSPLAGPAGTTVALYGTHLGDATLVQFNGVNSAFAVISGTELRATVPLGATTGPILVTTPTGSTRSADNFIVAASADLAVTLSDSPNPMILGGSLAYTIVVTNQGPSQATGVTLIHSLPASALFVSALTTQGSCQPANGAVLCSLGNLSSGASARLSVVVTPTLAGIITSSVSVRANEFDAIAANNLAQVMTSALPGPTTLAIQAAATNRVVISWPAAAANFVLQAAEQLSPPVVWVTVTNTPVVAGDRKTVAVPLDRNRFFRLSKP